MIVDSYLSGVIKELHMLLLIINDHLFKIGGLDVLKSIAEIVAIAIRQCHHMICIVDIGEGFDHVSVPEVPQRFIKLDPDTSIWS